MGFLEASHVVEAMREAGPAGLHVRDLAARVDCDPGKLGWFSDCLVDYTRLMEYIKKATFSGCWRPTTLGRRFP